MSQPRPAPRPAEPPPVLRCPWCGAPTPANYVHGHVQCVACKRNIDPCCEGEQAQS
jgi:hypothetical protein